VYVFCEFRLKKYTEEGRLDPNEFLKWLHTVERVFDYKEIPEDKNVKLIALELNKYVSL